MHNDLSSVIQTIQQLVHTELLPLEPEFLVRPFRTLIPRLMQVRGKVKRQGLWMPHLPRKHGGLGLSLQEFGQVSEALGYSPLGHYAFGCQAPDIGNAELLLEFGSERQKDSYLKPLLEGRIRSCFAMTEPEFAGSNPVRLGTTAQLSGWQYVINGHKWFTTAADGAAFAIVMALTQPDHPEAHKRASLLIVPTETPGFRLVRNISVMGHEGEDYHSHAEILFENCKVPAENLIGQPGEGFALAQHRLGPGRIHHCMRWLGICQRAFELMCARASIRALKDDEYLAQQQAVQHKIAECYAEIRAARMLVLDTARQIDEVGAPAARDHISMIKFHTAGVLQRVLDAAIQVHGALGLTDDTVLAYWYRHERAARIYDGPDEVHKTALARGLLRKQQPEPNPKPKTAQP